MPNHMGTSGILKLLSFADHLGQSLESPSPKPQLNGRVDETYQNQRRQANDLAYWHSFVDMFFSQKGVLRQALWSSETKDNKHYELSTPSLPRYYWAHFNSGITNIQMTFANAVEKNVPGVGHSVESHKSSFVYWFTNGHQVFGDPSGARFEDETDLA